MIFRVELPQVGESVTEGVIGRWLVSEGQAVRKYDPLVEVITDKVNIEMPSPVSGVVAKIVAAEGETLPMGAVIAEIDAEDGHASVPTPPADTLGTLVQGVAVGPTGAANVPQRDSSPTPAAAEAAGLVAAKGAQDRKASAVAARFSPAVKRLAEQHGLDPSAIPGTGRGGRVTRKDVEQHLAQREARGEDADAGSGEDRRVAASTVRRMIAENMARSAGEIPHAWGMVEVDTSGMVALRRAEKDRFLRETGHPLTYLAFAVSAAAAALREHPHVNASWDGGDVILRGRINIGVAVAAPDGLIVPVIEDADRLSIAETAERIDLLAGAARSGSLSPGQVRGGTFTVNNTGALGSVASGPIIVPGQAAILTTEAVVRRPVAVGEDAVAVRPVMNMCMSFDHRLLDGAGAGAFLQAVRGAIEAVGPGTPLDRPVALVP